MKVNRIFVFIALSIILVFGTGSGWWDGLEVERSNYEKAYPPNYYGTEGYKKAGFDLAKDLSNIPLSTHIARCRMVIEADTRAVQTRLENPHLPKQGPDSIDFLICMSAIHRIGETENKSWLPVLDEFAAAATGTQENLSAGQTVRGGRLSLNFHLQVAIGQSYKNIFLPDATPTQIVQGWRRGLIELPLGKAARYGYAQARRELLYQEPHDPEFVEAFLKLYTDENPEIRLIILGTGTRGLPVEAYDLRVAALADPDPRVRDRASRVFHGKKEYLVPALIRFLSRDDIDDSARNAALEKLKDYNYELGTGPDGELTAVPVNLPPEPDKDEILFLLRLIRHEDAGTAKRTDAINKLRQYGYSFGPGPDGSVMASPFRPNLEPVILPPDK